MHSCWMTPFGSSTCAAKESGRGSVTGLGHPCKRQRLASMLAQKTSSFRSGESFSSLMAIAVPSSFEKSRRSTDSSRIVPRCVPCGSFGQSLLIPGESTDLYTLDGQQLVRRLDRPYLLSLRRRRFACRWKELPCRHRPSCAAGQEARGLRRGKNARVDLRRGWTSSKSLTVDTRPSPQWRAIAGSRSLSEGGDRASIRSATVTNSAIVKLCPGQCPVCPNPPSPRESRPVRPLRPSLTSARAG